MARAKKEDIFYTLFKDLAAKLVEACDHYVEVMELKVYESECDNKVQRIMRELYDSFITPFDRQDISDLALAMDDIMDYMNGAALCLDLFNVQEMRGEAVQMARLTRRCVDEVSKMIDHLPNYKGDPEVMEHANMISDIRHRGRGRRRVQRRRAQAVPRRGERPHHRDVAAPVRPHGELHRRLRPHGAGRAHRRDEERVAWPTPRGRRMRPTQRRSDCEGSRFFSPGAGCP